LNEYKVSVSQSNFPLFTGRSSAAIQGSKPSKRALILRILLLRDYVQYLPYRNGVRVHGC
jgi:hypothetical protein